MKKLFVFFLLAVAPLVQAQDKTLTLDEIFSGRLSQKFVPGFDWIKNSHRYSVLEPNDKGEQSIVAIDALTNEREVLADGKDLVYQGLAIPFAHYEFSADGEHLLLTGALVARKLKTGGDVFIFNRKTKQIQKLPAKATDTVANVKLSPDGKSLGYVRGNNLFIADVRTLAEKQLTFDGSENILNGVFDWVYEEEFSIIDGWQWSPDSKQIAFWRLDQTAVPEFRIAHYDSLHLNFEVTRYPKAGEPNSLVKIGVINVGSGKTEFIDLGSNTDIYVPRVSWTRKNNLLAYQRLNRLQNKLEMFLYNTDSKSSKLVLTETSPAWVESENDANRFLESADEFIWKSERSGYNHFYLYDYNGNVKAQLTKGNWDADDLAYVDEPTRKIFFTAAEKNPMERHLYSVGLDGKNFKRLTKENGTHRVAFSTDGLLYSHSHSSFTSPTKSYLRKQDGSLVKTLEDNAALESTLASYKLGDAKFLSFKTTDGTSLNAWMLTPPNFDATKKYPALMYVYGGPGSQTVTDAFNGRDYLWYQHLAQQGYIIFSVDNRGTGFRGAAFKKITYKQLGIQETKDQVEGAKYLATLGYVDAARIGIWGWSYGGYMASMCMTYGNTLDKQIFKAGIAGAPVTHWKFYDTIYSERFMTTPALNPQGFEISASLSHASKLKGNFLLLHGTADDNVHFQNSVTFAKALQMSGIEFQTMFYPEQYHGVRGKQRVHLYKLMTKFLLEKL
jgi:dipeptidyl-peptidase 4